MSKARFTAPATLPLGGAFLGIVLATATGCSTWDFRGEGFKDEVAQTFGKLRPPSGDAELFGASEKARDIERSLGAN